MSSVGCAWCWPSDLSCSVHVKHCLCEQEDWCCSASPACGVASAATPSCRLVPVQAGVRSSVSCVLCRPTPHPCRPEWCCDRADDLHIHLFLVCVRPQRLPHLAGGHQPDDVRELQVGEPAAVCWRRPPWRVLQPVCCAAAPLVMHSCGRQHSVSCQQGRQKLCAPSALPHCPLPSRTHSVRP